MSKQEWNINLREVIASAPASIANLGCLFDLAAMAVDYGRDIVRVRVEQGYGIEVLSRDPKVPSGEKNTAYRAAKAFLSKISLSSQEVSVCIEVDKGVEPGIGLGSSGATAAAVAKALNEIFGKPLDENELVEVAGSGEVVAAGTAHYDNVAASLLGDIAVIVSRKPIRVIKLKVLSDLSVLLIIPKVEVRSKRKKTEFLRKVLPSNVSLNEMVEQCSAVSEFFIALMRGDIEMLGRAISRGGIVEHERSRFIPNYWRIKEIALELGALGFNIAGAGPSMFAVLRKADAPQVLNIMKEELERIGVEAELRLLKPEPIGARIERRVKLN